MAIAKSLNVLIQGLLDFFRLTQPDLDTKPGTVARDLFIDAPSNQLALLYDELQRQANLQSIRQASGTDLDKLSQNYGATRKSAAKSSGIAIVTFSSIPAVVNIFKGGFIKGSNGLTFVVTNGVSVNPNAINVYRSIATKYRNDLDFIGIKDQYAVEVNVQSSTSGLSGNISKYTLTSTSIPGISNVTNVNSFLGGTNQEDDTAFRNRVLAIFSGSNIGTSLGYKNIALSDTDVSDALVIEPGDSLMVRDGTQVAKNSDGSFTIVSEGQGGKVDIITLGTRLGQIPDTFIYRDKSNKNDPTDSKNIFVLGQIAGDENKTINRKRIDNIKAGTLPTQPVDSIVEVTGSLSGTNFQPKTIDSLGRVSGNYELIKDTGVYAGSSWGFDKFHWINNKISLFSEDIVKSKFNGQDATTFTDVLRIPSVTQNISITNENSNVVSVDRSIIQLLHYPLTNVTRVFNSSTGERYTIINQNLDGTGSINTTGRVKIIGNTLPSSSDILQVDYTWIVSYDQYVDYDGREFTDNSRAVTDSIDWGYSNLIRLEPATFSLNSSGAFFSTNTTHQVNTVLNVFSFSEVDGTTVRPLTGIFAGRITLTLSNLLNPISNILSIKIKNTNTEVFDLNNTDSVIQNNRIVSGTSIRYNVLIVFSSDTFITEGQLATTYFNQIDLFTVNNSTGNFSNNQITIPIANIPAALLSSSNTVFNTYINYIANVQESIGTSLVNYPVSRLGNGYSLTNSIGFPNTISSNIIRRENQTIISSGLNFIVPLNAVAADVSLTTSQIISVIRLSDSKELWNLDNPGTVSVNGTTGNYQLTFTSFNTPAVADQVIIFYSPIEIKRSQPFTFYNKIIRTEVDNLQLNISTGELYAPMHTFVLESGTAFQIIEPNTGIIIASSTSVSNSLTPILDLSTALLHGGDITFSSIENITQKKIRVLNSTNRNNNGVYDIININTSINSITLSQNLSYLTNNQISVIRLLDNKDLWTTSCTIDIANNRLILPFGTNATNTDSVVVVYTIPQNLRQSGSRFGITITDQTNNTGVISVTGTSISKATDIVFTAINDGFKQNVNEAIRKYLNLSSNGTIPSSLNLVKVAKLEKINATSNNDVLSVISTYNLEGISLKDNVFFTKESNPDSTLSNVEFRLLGSVNNLANSPKIGDKLRITFYYTTPSDSESIYFTKNGTLYTNKFFTTIDKSYISSGFSKIQTAKVSLALLNQPATGSRYKAFYDYTAPKQNERIIIKYNYNKVISDVTFQIEKQRPINADVLAKSANKILVNAEVNVVVKDSFLTSSNVVLQNVKDKLISVINTNKLGDILNNSDLIVAAQSINGVDRARVITFNKNGNLGQVLTIQLQKNEYFSANTVNVNLETR